jgi:hypothetical protein
MHNVEDSRMEVHTLTFVSHGPVRTFVYCFLCRQGPRDSKCVLR